MTDNEIVRDFEIVLNDLKDRVGKNTYDILKQSFDLINRQKAEIEENNLKIDHQAQTIRTFETALTDKMAEIDRLLRSLDETNKYIPKIKERTRTEAIKECAKKVKKAFPSIAHWIDNLLKEMTESQ